MNKYELGDIVIYKGPARYGSSYDISFIRDIEVSTNIISMLGQIKDDYKEGARYRYILSNDNVLYEDEILGVVGDINTIIVKTTETNKTESNKQELTEDQLQLLVDLVAYFNEWDHPIDFDREYLIEELYNILKRKSL